MQIPPGSLPEAPAAPTAPAVHRHEALIAMPVAAALLAGLGWLLYATVLKGVGAPQAEIEALRATLNPPAPMLTNPKPVECALFLLLCLAAPFCAVLALRIAPMLLRCFAGKIGPSVRTGLAVAGGAFVYLSFLFQTSLGSRLLSLHVFDDRTLAAQFPAPAWDAVAAVVSAGILFFALPHHALCGSSFAQSWRSLLPQRRRRMWGACIALAAALLLFLPRALGIDSALADGTRNSLALRLHFQAFAFAITQVFAGKALVLTCPLYGGYPEFLLPVFRLIGLSLFKIAMVLTVLCWVSVAAMIGIVTRFVRHSIIFVSVSAAILFFCTESYHVEPQALAFDPYFQYWPLRVLFPAISIPLYLWTAKQKSRLPWIGFGAFCGMALHWNCESGVAVTGAAFFALFAEATGLYASGSAKWRARLVGIALAGGALCAVYLAFMLHLRLAAHGVPPLHTTVDYQRFFYRTGYMMSPLPRELHPWMAVLGIYLLGLLVALRSFLDGRCTPFARLCVFVSIMGTGLFTYYQGHGHDLFLKRVAWPAVLLGFILADRLFRAIRAGLFAPGLRWLVFPAIYFGAVSILLLPRNTAMLARVGVPRWQAALTGRPMHPADSMRPEIDFIRRFAGHDHTCAILTVNQAVHYAETGCRFEYDLPGMSELFFKADDEALRQALAVHRTRHLFIDRFSENRLAVGPTLAARYRLVATYHCAAPEASRRTGVGLTTCPPAGDIDYFEPLN